MTMQGSQDGVAAFMEYAFVAAPGGQTRFVGADSKGFVLNYTPGFLWAVVDGFWVHPDDFNASDGSSVTFTTAVDQGTHVRLIALSPFNVANVYSQLQSDTLYAKRRNRIIDPGMRVSQEQGSNLLTTGGLGVLYYASDSFAGYRYTTAGAMTVQRIALTTPGGSPYRVRATVTTANPTPAAGDQALLLTKIEGLDVADLRFGSTVAKTITVRFGCRVSVAGTYSVALANAASNRSWIGSITIAPAEIGVDVVKSVTLTADQTGTWAADNTVGLALYITLCAGSTYQGVIGWQAGSVQGLAGGVNLMATNGATFDLFDVGLYDVTGLQSGVIPPFELASYAEDLLKCQRYFEYIPITTNASVYYLWWSYKARKRVAPSLTLAAGSTNGATIVNAATVDDGTWGIRQNTLASAASDALYAANARL